MDQQTPSRHYCEEQIRRILMTEVLQHGRNTHFKSAKDFMTYFESLYPPGPALTKQVQRAIKSMDMPKDKNGFLIIDKSKGQLSQDKELALFLSRSNALEEEMEPLEFLFLRTELKYRDYLLQIIRESDTLKGKYYTALPSSDGILFFCPNKNRLSALLENLKRLDR